MLLKHRIPLRQLHLPSTKKELLQVLQLVNLPPLQNRAPKIKWFEENKATKIIIFDRGIIMFLKQQEVLML